MSTILLRGSIMHAYKRLIEPLPNKSQWPKLDLSSEIGAPLDKRPVGRQWKNRIKSVLEAGGGQKKPQDEGMNTEKRKRRIKGPTKCQKMWSTQT
jgi:hypothetical protein